MKSRKDEKDLEKAERKKDKGEKKKKKGKKKSIGGMNANGGGQFSGLEESSKAALANIRMGFKTMMTVRHRSKKNKKVVVLRALSIILFTFIILFIIFISIVID